MGYEVSNARPLYCTRSLIVRGYAVTRSTSLTFRRDDIGTAVGDPVRDIGGPHAKDVVTRDFKAVVLSRGLGTPKGYRLGL